MRIAHPQFDAADAVRLLEVNLRRRQGQEHDGGVVVLQPGIEDRRHLVGAHARDGAEGRYRALRRDQSESIADLEAVSTRHADADGNGVLAGKVIEAAGLDIAADLAQATQIVLDDAAYQATAGTAAVGGNQHLPIQHRHRGDNAGKRAQLRGEGFVVRQLLPGIGLDGDMAVHAEDPGDEFGLKAAHYRGDDDQGGDAKRDADERENRDDGDEAFALARAQVTPGDRTLKGGEHA